eukprot:1208796-Rhodomonas_salina.1
MSQGSKGVSSGLHQEKNFKGVGWDSREALANKTSQWASIIGGSNAAGQATLPYMIFNACPQLSWLQNAPES